MRQEVYTKFAEALQRKQSEQAAATRHQEVVAKFAEALDRQTAQKQAEAIYCEGFCKAAELAGVDPNALVKQALGLGDITAMGKSVMGGAKRVGQLLAGGDASKLKNLKKVQDQTAALGKGFDEWLKYLGRKPGLSPVGKAINAAQRLGSKALIGYKKNIDLPLSYAFGGGSGRGVMASRDEIRKVLAARLGAGAAATGVAGAGIAATTGGDQE